MASCHEALHEAGDLTPRRLDKLIDMHEGVGTSQSGGAGENESQSEHVAEKAIWWHGWMITVVASIVTAVSIAPMQSFAIGNETNLRPHPVQFRRRLKLLLNYA